MVLRCWLGEFSEDRNRNARTYRWAILLEKLLLEACLEAMRTGAVMRFQDMARPG